MKKHVLFVLLAFLVVAVSSHAQGLGSIAGRITDPEGASVANAKVTALQAGTGFSRTALSDTEGLFVIPSLQPATYDLSVEANGFSTARESGIIDLIDGYVRSKSGLYRLLAVAGRLPATQGCRALELGELREHTGRNDQEY